MRIDLGSIIGLIGAFVVITIGIRIAGDFNVFVDIPSMFIVIGAGFFTFFLTNPTVRIKGFFGALKKLFTVEEYQPQNIIPLMVSLAEKARKEGILALESEVENLNDEFLKRGLQMVVDGLEADTIKHILSTELEFVETRHSSNRRIFNNLSTLVPAYGLIGTLIGLVLMLRSLDDPTALGPNMAVALITTFYGAILANVVFTPMAFKLQNKSEEELFFKEIMIDGITAIQSGENPRIIKDRLESYLERKYRVSKEER